MWTARSNGARQGQIGKLILAVPGIFEQSGGIARICRALALACHRYCVEGGLQFSTLALGDRPGARDLRYLPEPSEYRAFSFNRLAFSLGLFKCLKEAPRSAIIFGHVNLSSLGLVLSRDVRYAVLVHGIEAWEPLPIHRRLGLVRAHSVWAVSEYSARKAKDIHRAKEERVRVLPNCLDPFWEGAAQTAKSALPREGPPYALVVSRLSRGDGYKGIDLAIQAFAVAERLWPGAEFWIVGDGDDRARLMNLAEVHGVKNKVRFLGAVSDEKLFDLYSHCSYFVMPSRKEGFGLVFLEAMAFAKPVIAAACGGTPEVVVHDGTGLLVPFGDVPALADAMVKVVQPRTADLLGTAGLARLNTHFRFDHYERQVREAIGSLVAG